MAIFDYITDFCISTKAQIVDNVVSIFLYQRPTGCQLSSHREVLQPLPMTILTFPLNSSLIFIRSFQNQGHSPEDLFSYVISI